jgi:TolB-like protein
MHMKLCSFVFLSFALLLSPAEGYAVQKDGAEKNGLKEKIVIFDFENLSVSDNATAYVMPAVRRLLESKGVELQDEKGQNVFLISERVRTTSYISGELARKMAKELNVTAVLLGTVYTFSMDSNPQLGLSARLVDISNGEIVWSEYASATGDDFTTILGLGTLHSMEELLPEVMDRLFASFTTDPPLKEAESTYRIAVMPFSNKSEVRGIGMLPTYMSMVELFKKAIYVPVEYGEVRTAIVNAKIRERGEVDYRSITSISESVNVDGILVGTIERYSDGLEKGTAPEVLISARLINARNNRIVWCDSYQIDGDQDISILDFGKIRTVDKVAYML